MPTLPPSSFDTRLKECPFCASAKLTDYDRTFEDIRIDRCGNCGTKFMNPQCTDEYLTTYYNQYDHYLPDQIDSSQVDQQRTKRRRRAKVRNMEMIASFQSRGRFLSVGCGDGMELEVAQELGWEVEGYEVNPDITKKVAHRLSVPVYSGDFCHLGLRSEYYDCVYMDQVLEHLKNPQEYLHEANRLLRAGGILYIGCPNITSLSNSWKTITGRVGLQRRRGRHYDLCKHLFYFSPGVLTSLVRDRFHFDILSCEGAPLSGIKTSNEGMLGRVMERLIRKFPVFDSTFHFVARKSSALSISAGKNRVAA